MAHNVLFKAGLSTSFYTVADGVKTFKITPDANTLYFLTDTHEIYKGTDLYASGAAAADIASLATRIGTAETNIGSTTALGTSLKAEIDTLKGSGDGSIAKAITTAVEALDVDEFATVTVADGVVTLKAALKEVDGKVAAGTATADVVLAKVATTGAAADVTIADATNVIAATTVEGALTEIAANIDTVEGIIGNASKAETAEGAGDGVEASGLIKRIETIEGLTGTTSVDDQIDAKIDALAGSATQAASADNGQLALTVTSENGEVKSITGSITANTYDAYGAASAVQGDTTTTVKGVEDKIGTVPAKVGETDTATVVSYVDAKVAAANTAGAVTISSDTTTEGALKTYTFTQNGAEIGKIDLAKDLVVTSGEVVKDPEGQTAGTYLKLTIANQTAPVYINVKDLVEDFTVEDNAAQVQLEVSDTREISASIVEDSITKTELADTVVTEIEAATTAIGKEKAGETAGTGIYGRIETLEAAVGAGGSVATQIQTEIEKLDATVTNAATGENAVQPDVVVSVTEADGKLTAVTATVTEGRFMEYEDKTALNTTAKTVVGAINELDAALTWGTIA